MFFTKEVNTFCNTLDVYRSCFTKPQWKHFNTYLTGLLLGEKGEKTSRTLHVLRNEIVRYKNKIHAILPRNGIYHRDYSDLFGAGVMKFLRCLTFSDSEQYSLTSYLNIVETQVHIKAQITKKIEVLCKNNHQAMLLTSIPGISYYSAMIILTEMGEIHRFPHPKKHCSYAGLVPRTIQSGSHVYHERILKECNQNLKWILDQCTHIHI
ncbi:MAG: transposase [Candidatus Thermoplasmatota archaeon]|nr:transposase [Candidatus Thermoplasmatota archaeon]